MSTGSVPSGARGANPRFRNVVRQNDHRVDALKQRKHGVGLLQRGGHQLFARCGRTEVGNVESAKKIMLEVIDPRWSAQARDTQSVMVRQGGTP